MYYNKSKKLSNNIYYYIIGSVVIFVFFGKNLISYIRSMISTITAKNNVDHLQDQTNPSNPGSVNNSIRVDVVKSVANSVHDEIKNTFQDEKSIVDQMNTLNNPREVSFISSYYQDQFNKNLKSELIQALKSDSWYMANSGERFIDLKKFIQDNLL